MYGERMPVMLQVRNLPDEVHAKLKQRARDSGMSLSEYVAAELAALVQYRTNAEIFADARARAAASGVLPGQAQRAGIDGANLVRDARAERDDELAGR